MAETSNELITERIDNDPSLVDQIEWITERQYSADEDNNSMQSSNDTEDEIDLQNSQNTIVRLDTFSDNLNEDNGSVGSSSLNSNSENEEPPALNEQEGWQSDSLPIKSLVQSRINEITPSTSQPLRSHNVHIENSRNVYVGDTTQSIYQGPVTIQQYFSTQSQASSANAIDQAITADIESQNEENSTNEENLSETSLSSVTAEKSSRTKRWIVIICSAVTILSLIYVLLFISKSDPDVYTTPATGTSISSTTPSNSVSLEIVSRSEWGAEESLIEYKNLISLPPSNVIILDISVTGFCSTRFQCIEYVRYVNKYNRISYGDMAYNFVVGGDGAIYEGRGWDVAGDHTKEYDNNSIGIGFLGNYYKDFPTMQQLEITKRFLEIGVEQNKLSQNYKLFGQRQVKATLNPGVNLYQQIQTWKHWVEMP